MGVTISIGSNNLRPAGGHPGGPLMSQSQRHASRAAWRKARRSVRTQGLVQIWAGCFLGLLALMLPRLLGVPDHPNYPIAAILLGLSGCAWGGLQELRLAHRVDQSGDRLCLHCRYDLRDLGDTGECPECGAEFSLPELSEAWNRLVPPWRRALAQSIFGRR